MGLWNNVSLPFGHRNSKIWPCETLTSLLNVSTAAVYDPILATTARQGRRLCFIGLLQKVSKL